MRYGRLVKRSVVVFLFGCLFTISNQARSSGATKITFSTINLGSLSWPILVAKERGIFAAEGLLVELAELRKTSLVAQSLIAQSTPIATLGPDAVIMAVEKGAKLSLVSATIRRSASRLVGHPKYRSVKNLKKATIGTGGPGGSTTQLKMILRKEGLTDNDYSFLIIGPTPDRYMALRAGAIDAALLSPTASFKAVDEGFSVLASVGDYIKEYIQLCITVNMDYASRNPDAVVKFIKSVIKATKWLKDNKNKEQAIDILVKYEKLERNIASRMYDFLVNELDAISNNGEINPEGMRQVIEVMAMDGVISPPLPQYSKFINPTFLDMAHKELAIGK